MEQMKESKMTRRVYVSEIEGGNGDYECLRLFFTGIVALSVVIMLVLCVLIECI